MDRYIAERWAEYGLDMPVRTMLGGHLSGARSRKNIRRKTGRRSWRDPKTAMRYDRSKQNLQRNAINFVTYDE